MTTLNRQVHGKDVAAQLYKPFIKITGGKQMSSPCLPKLLLHLFDCLCNGNSELQINVCVKHKGGVGTVDVDV